ncbi:MAG: polysaccharide biosynthesis protein [Chloroflexi bacterium]|nr:polysaccharide biosynthesis protein [Chloroflexota bacterium]
MTSSRNTAPISLTNFLTTLRNRHLFTLDLLLWFITAAFALWLRVDDWVWRSTFSTPVVIYTLVACGARFVIYRRFGLYSRFWRYASVDELAQIAFAAFTTMAFLCVLFWWLIPPLGILIPDLPRSIPLIDGLLVFVATSGIRYSIRIAERLRQRRRSAKTAHARVIVFGAGEAGTMIVREMQRNPKLGLEPVAFLDADPAKQGTWILGVPVIGDRTQLADVVDKYSITQAIIAIPSAPGKTIRELTHLCQENNLPVKTIPGMSDLLDGKHAVNQLRPVEITDLLRREPIATDMSHIAQLVQGKRVLVTGAGGSIGSELCRQIAQCAPAELVLLGHGENSIFEVCNELQRNLPSAIRHPQFAVRPVIADVRDAARLRAVFTRVQPQIVFHAAAHKHVPLMEENLEEAVTNNVLGTRNVIQSALDVNAAHLVLISTDKAVNPTSVMGVTKRIAEMLVQSAAHTTGKNLVAVRFGNVLDSRGSVVPLFKQQIARGGPITITHPEIRRYFMTIPEAVQLVLQTTVLGKSGGVYVLDMGEPVKIVDLARDLIRLSGLEPDEIAIEFTGLRPGEKLFEELFIAGEEYTRTAHDKIFVARNGGNAISHSQSSITNSHSPKSELLDEQVNMLIAAAQCGETAKVRELLNALVPEYRPAQQ